MKILNQFKKFPVNKLFQGIIPIQRNQIPLDIIAGFTLAALAIPEVIGYAKIAGMPVVTGLYTLLLPMLFFAIFGSSRHLVVGADSATAAILVASLVHLAVPGSSHYIALAGMVSLLAGLFLFLARIFRLAFIADFLSRTVLIGFLSGVGLQVALGQIPGLCGAVSDHSHILLQIFTIGTDISQIHLPTLIFSILIIIVILFGQKMTANIPWTLIVVIISIIISYTMDLTAFGISLTGQVPGGLPSIVFPEISPGEIPSLLGLAAACFVVILTQSAATSRAYAFRYQEKLDESSDLIGLGFANIAAAVSGTFVINGSPTKTEMVDNAGGKTQLAHLVTVGIVLFILLFLTAPLEYLPEAVLASIVFTIGIRLINLVGLKQIRSRRPVEFAVALATTFSVVIAGVGWGIAFAMVLSMIAHLRHSYHPLNHLLYVRPDGRWGSASLDSGRHAVDGLVMYRFGANLYYANESRMNEEIREILNSSALPVHWFCLLASSVNDIDYSASETLIYLSKDLNKRNIRLVFCELEEQVRRELISDNPASPAGKEYIFATKDDVIQAYKKWMDEKNS